MNRAAHRTPTLRRTVVVEGPLSLRMRRFAAAREGEVGLQITTLPLLAARLAGGFIRPAAPEEFEPAIRAALESGGLDALEPLRLLPGTARAVSRALQALWEEDRLASDDDRGHASATDLRIIDARVRESLTPGALVPPDLQAAALKRIEHAVNVFGPIVVEGPTYVAPVWRPLLDRLARHADTTIVSRHPDVAGDLGWFDGRTEADHSRETGAQTSTSCATPRDEAVESIRWAREIITSGRARPEQIAICATSPQAWDPHILSLARQAGVPLHFTHGLPALATGEGQACAALADVLLNGLSQDRIRRLLRTCGGRGTSLRDLPRTWASGLQSRALLDDTAHWHQALERANDVRSDGFDPRSLIAIIDLLAAGVSSAHQVGELILDARSRELWRDALRRAPAEALEYSLGELRVPDISEAGVRVAWCPAAHLAASPRPFARLLGMTTRSWPRSAREDPLRPRQPGAHDRREATVAERDRRAFHIITAWASGDCVLSRSRHDGRGARLVASPLTAACRAHEDTSASNVPRHALSETDRLAARPEEALQDPAIASATRCWREWHRPQLTPHDGLVAPLHPAILRATSRVQSATSLQRMLRDPLGFVWEYALGWRPVEDPPRTLTLSGRTYGELVHRLLRDGVDLLAASGPGLASATGGEIAAALSSAADLIVVEWPATRATPPALLWRHVVSSARDLALTALTRDTFEPGTRSWTEVPFGLNEHEEAGRADLPWNPKTSVLIPGTDIRLRGTIDRLDVSRVAGRARVTDYKTGAEPKGADRLVFGQGAELQRVLYATAVRLLMGTDKPVIARLTFLKAGSARSYRLDVDDGLEMQGAAMLHAGRALLSDGHALPGPMAGRSDDPFRIARPASSERYNTLKRAACDRAFGEFSRVWSCP